MKISLFLTAVLTKLIIGTQALPGHLLHRNNIDTTGKTLLFTIHASSCKNSIYLNREMFNDAASEGYKTYFCVSGLAKEDLPAFKEENGFTDEYPVIIDKDLNLSLQSNSIYLLQGTKIQIITNCNDAEPIYNQFQKEQGKNKKTTVEKVIDSIPVDTSYKFYSGSGAYLNDQYCLVMDFRHSRKLHKINMLTGKIAQQFTLDEKQWAEKIYKVIYNGNAAKVSKSVKSRQLYIKKDRIFNNQEFEPENITIKNSRIILSVRFHFPYIDELGDTLSKNTKILFQLNDSLQITDYWVAPMQLLKDDFYILMNTDMTPLLTMGDTVCLPVAFVHHNYETPPKKYNYAKFILDKNHNIVFHSYLPFLVPDEKAKSIGDYKASHMYLFKFGEQIAGSYITFPSIYNLTTNTKIYDIELVGYPKQRKGKIDSMLFAKDLNNLTFVINYFDRYKDKYYLMQAKNGTWNSFVLFDNNLIPIKTVYLSPVTKYEGRAFYSAGDNLYLLKFGVKNESDMYIMNRSISNLFDMEIE